MAVQVEQQITKHLDLWTQAQTAKSTSGRGSNNKIELTGIKKLRELILELAVRGKLVPQDPNDEPASELLKRVAAEKDALIKAGKLKKQKPLPPISDEEKPFELPIGWEWTRLGQLGLGATGKTPSTSRTELFVGDIPFIGPGQISGDGVLLEAEKFLSEDAVSHSTEGLPNDILTVCIGGSIGKSTLLKSKVCFNQQINSLRPLIVNPNFILYSVRSLSFMNALINQASGSATPIINRSKWEELLLPLPCHETQHKIVDKVDELMALCDQLEQQSYQQVDAHNQLVDAVLATLTQSQNADELASNWQRLAAHFDTLFTTEYSIDALKQTILQLAVMGKLVKQDPNDEPASELLKRIAAEKDALVKAGKIKKQKPLPPISEDEKPFELPEGWEWCRLDSLSLSSEAGWSPQCDNVPRENKSWGVLKVSAVTWGTYNENENKALPAHFEPRLELEVKPHDFLISRANTAELVARAVVVPEDAASNLMLSDKIIRFKFTQQISSSYVNLVNNSFHARQYYSKVAGGTSSSMKNVSRVQIQNLVIPLPSLKEQEQILRRVSELRKLCDGLVSKLNSAKQTQAVLAEALVEQVVA